MDEKIKVSRKLAEAIESNLQVRSKDMFLKDHAKPDKWGCKINLPLNDISLLELAEILIKGYEIEETPEEKALEYYNELGRRNLEGIQRHIVNVLELVNIKIEGIND